MKEIARILEFIVEIEKLKDVHRKTRPVGLERVENSAEHSWHVCLAALMLKDHADQPVDIDRVIRMLLIHDLGEIDAGDTIIYQSETAENKAAEAAGVARVLGMLPGGKGDEYLALWHEFEAGETADSRYARAIDRVPPLLHNLHAEGESWRRNRVPKDKVFEINARIGQGSHALWDEIRSRLDEAVGKGWLE
ncbi:MAG: HD domain-containing protein [Oceanospirillaceae bacterium]|nr:HD domain-containing protein [Oceanospirillaceae bacterium]